MDVFNCSSIINTDDLEDESMLIIIVSSIFLVLSLIFFPIFYIYFIIKREQRVRLKKRNIFLFTAYYLGFFLTSIFLSSFAIVGIKHYSCHVSILLGFTIVLLLFVGGIFRLIGLYLRISFNTKLLTYTHSTFTKGKLLLKPGKETFISIILPDSNTVPNQPEQIQQEESTRETKCQNFLKITLFKLFCWKTQEGLANSLQFDYFLSSKRFINISFCFVSVVLGLFLLVIHQFKYPLNSDCKGCTIDDNFVLVLIIFVVNGVVACVLLYILKSHEDPLGIKFEMTFIALSFVFISVCIILPLGFILLEQRKQGKLSTELLVVLQCIFSAWFSTVYQVKQAKKVEQIEENNDISLTQILDSERSRIAFGLFLAVHLSIENLYFYSAVKEWKKNYSTNSESVNKETAESILRSYVLKDALFYINISGETRQTIIDLVRQDLSESVFDEVQDEVFSLMQSGCFYKFLKSKYYQAYRNEIMLTL